ncbi:hypothetical protein QAD02_010905 [Eretmocerus hayati]|uniref:Uncharacterized protein n=1 Tax=Eretmocerus hayati TaxID=131215 RepID=A0ACC2NVJ1_9HYME|nr:hypothetical protein QAD02_010905 [Eretmocerus hayati]
MDLKIVLSFFTVISMFGFILADKKHPLMMYIVNYMKENLSTYQVTVMTKSINALGPFSSRIVKIMIDEFSSVVGDSSAIAKIPVRRTFGDSWYRSSDQSKLKIGIVELQQESDTLNELWEMLEFFMKYSKYIRGKCIILLVNGDGQSLESFLRLAWSKDFLDLTVIEWTVEVPDKFLMGQDSVHYQAYIHVYNPFKNNYAKDVLGKDTDILPDKLKNLHGYELHTAIYNNNWDARIDENYQGTNDLDRFQGEDVQRTKLLSETLNFKANPIFVTYEDLRNDKLNNETNVPRIDYYSTLFLTRLSEINETLADHAEWTNNQSTSTAYLQSMSQTRLYVIQQKVREPYTSSSFILSCGSLATMILIFSSFSRILKLNGKIWSVAKITHVLMGGSMDRQRGISFREKIFLITLYLTSIITMTITLDELLKMNLSEKEILRFKTLQELADSGVSLRVTNRTKVKLLDLGKHNRIMQKIADQAIESELFPTSLNDIPDDATSSSVFADLDDRWNEWLPNVFSTDGVWFATEIEDNIVSRVDLMKFRKRAPYNDRFVKMTTKLVESGLMRAYAKQEAGYFLRSSWLDGVVPKDYRAHHHRANDKEVEMPMNDRLILILLMGYCLACFALLHEFRKSTLSPRCPSILKLLKNNCSQPIQKPMPCMVKPEMTKKVDTSSDKPER